VVIALALSTCGGGPVLEVEPDFVAASFEPVLGTGGVATHLAPTDCGAEDIRSRSGAPEHVPGRSREPSS
jgi:hypothetical protein